MNDINWNKEISWSKLKWRNELKEISLISSSTMNMMSNEENTKEHLLQFIQIKTKSSLSAEKLISGKYNRRSTNKMKKTLLIIVHFKINSFFFKIAGFSRSSQYILMDWCFYVEVPVYNIKDWLRLADSYALLLFTVV